MRKVSIIVPIYDVEKYIKQCVVSLFQQTYNNIEYVFVDDCTPDSSVAILQETLINYPNRHEQIKLIHHNQNRGSGATRKTGLRHATGELVMFVDSDDYITANCVETLERRQAENGADIVEGAYITFSGNRELSVTHPALVSSKEKYLKAILMHNTVSHQIWGRIIRRDFFQEAEVDFVEGVNNGEDYSVMGRLLLTARRDIVDEPVYCYRYNDYGTFSDGISSRHIVSIMRANGVVCEYIRKHDKTKEYNTALQIGMLHTVWCALNVGRSASEVYEICGRPTNIFFRFCLLFAHQSTQGLLRWIYLVIKKLYKMCVLHIH